MGDIPQNTSYDNNQNLNFPVLAQAIKKSQGQQSSLPEIMPKPIAGNVTTPFMGATQNEPVHPGVDIANSKGTPIPAITNGVVVDMSNEPGNFGNSIVIKDEQGNLQRFSHLERAFVRVGQLVQKGQEIGTMGNSGDSYSPSGQGDGSHLDLRIRDAYGKMQNPMKFISK